MTLELQQTFRENSTVNETLVDEPFADLTNVVATTTVREERAAELEAESERFNETEREVNETTNQLIGILDDAAEHQREYNELNATYEAGEIGSETCQSETTRIEREFESLDNRAVETLDEDEYAAFEPLIANVRSDESALFSVEQRYERGEINQSTRDQRHDELTDSTEASYEAIETDVLADDIATLEERGERIEQLRTNLSDSPSLETQRETLESMNQSEIDDVLKDILAEDGSNEVFAFLPIDYEVGSTTAPARSMYVTQEGDVDVVEGTASDRMVHSQQVMDDLVTEHTTDDSFVFGGGVYAAEIDKSFEDSIVLVMPLALVFVVTTLSIAYRDILDILLGTVGIVIVLLWTFGFMGWVGIEFNQILLSVPVLLIGLSIDYAIHVFMRQREHRTEDNTDSSTAMYAALTGLGVALIWVTLTAVFGFLSNLVSSIPPIREFGIVSAFGVFATLLVFGTFVPATKVTLDEFFEARGIDRRKRAFGTGGGRFSTCLGFGQRIARRAPVVVLLIVLVVTAGAAYGATGIDSSFEEKDFFAEETPELAQSLPEPFSPEEYVIQSRLDYVNDNFVRGDFQSQILLDGNVTDPDTLAAIDGVADKATETESVLVLANGEPEMESPLTAMEAVAAENESFNDTYRAADTTGDGVPDENVTGVYDVLFDADPDRASDVIHRSDDGEYESVRLLFSVEGDADTETIRDDAESLAATMDVAGADATATGQPIVFEIIESSLFTTVIYSLVLALGSVVVFLSIAYRIVADSALLGIATSLPIFCSVVWILGTMALIGIPFNAITGTITALTIGHGIAYNIHITERYRLELSRVGDVWQALYRSVTGTGGALLGSAATTIGAFSVLVFSIIPVLQQFGIVTGLTILYAFLGSAFILPTVLVLWTRYVGPREAFPETTSNQPAAESQTEESLQARDFDQ